MKLAATILVFALSTLDHNGVAGVPNGATVCPNVIRGDASGPERTPAGFPGAEEINIGNYNLPDCIQKCEETNAAAVTVENKVTNSIKGKCFCEYGVTHRVGSPWYKNCFLDSVRKVAGVPRGSTGCPIMKSGDPNGVFASETLISNSYTLQTCISKCKERNAAAVTVSNDVTDSKAGKCYCEYKVDYTSGSPSFKSCYLEQTECMGKWTRKPCNFPFRRLGVEYNGCRYMGRSDRYEHWCPTDSGSDLCNTLCPVDKGTEMGTGK